MLEMQGAPLQKINSSLQFHHIGVAAKNIERELQVYKSLGYECESAYFEDTLQGIRGMFLTARGAPRLEMLENLKGSHTLDLWLERGQKFYHVAYCTDDIESMMASFCMNRAKVISPLKMSAYFSKKICFLMLPNRQLLELIEI